MKDFYRRFKKVYPLTVKSWKSDNGKEYLGEFNLAEYLIFYNTEKPHKSLGLKSPLEYLVEKGGMSQMYVTYTYY